MPELPEVETVARGIRPGLVRRRIVGFETRWPRQVSPDAATVARSLRGLRVEDVSRRGKFIVWRLEDRSCLLIHLRMSGRMEWLDGAEPPHVRAVWTLDDRRRLALCDARKFARITHADSLAALHASVGLEPLDGAFTARRLAALLAARRRRLKPLLLDQTVIAGLGNIYTDEALFRAGLHPLTPSDRVAAPQARELWRSIRAVLREGIRRNGASLDWVYPGGRMQDYFRVYGREGRPCVRCSAPIEYLRVGQRGTHVCPRCQPLKPR